MTVAELIEQLQELPPEMEVWAWDNELAMPFPAEGVGSQRTLYHTDQGWAYLNRGKSLETKTVLLIG